MTRRPLQQARDHFGKHYPFASMLASRRVPTITTASSCGDAEAKSCAVPKVSLWRPADLLWQRGEMDEARAIEKLTALGDATAGLMSKDMSDPGFVKWRRDSEAAIRHIFGPEHANLQRFKDIRFRPMSYLSGDTRRGGIRFSQGLTEAAAVLTSMIEEIRDFGSPAGSARTSATLAPLSVIERLCQRFPVFVRQLRQRHGGRPPLSINDEYDVQDLFHALLRLQFDDVRREEATPSHAGGGARTDFLIRADKIVIEVKKTRPTLTDKKLGEELLIDQSRYAKHPDCGTLVCFVYDPEGHIGNPAGLKHDLESQAMKPTMQVHIVQAV